MGTTFVRQLAKGPSEIVLDSFLISFQIKRLKRCGSRQMNVNSTCVFTNYERFKLN